MNYEVTEKQAAGQCSRSIKSCQSKIRKQAEKYGGDFPYIEATLERVIDVLDDAVSDLKGIE